MSYVLFLGFKSIVYKEPAIIRISLDNVFIDEFSLIPNSSCDVKDYYYKSEYFRRWSDKNSLADHPYYKKNIPADFSKFFHEDIIFKIFELDEKFIKEKQKHNLVIELIDSDNNFTNGFITKSTMISLDLAYLIPKSILLKFDIYNNNYINNKKEYRSKHLTIDSIKNSYKTKLTQFDLLKNNSFENEEKQGTYCLKWYSNVSKDKTSISLHEWRGDKGYFDLSFDTDWINDNIDTNNFKKYILNETDLKVLSYKYNEYENKRNFN